VKPKLVAALREVLETEAALAAEYRKVGERHATEHDVFHTCHELALQCEAHAGRIRTLADGAGVDVGRADGHDSLLHGVVETARRKAAAAMGRTDKTGPLLLRDLRRLFTSAADCEIAWTIVGQGAKAARELEVVDLFGACCEETAGQLRWIKTRIKAAAPQVLAVG
jgi:hypothetical protein